MPPALEILAKLADRVAAQDVTMNFFNKRQTTQL